MTGGDSSASSHPLTPSSCHPLPNLWRGRRVTVFGLGRHGGGVGAARWLAEQGARLTITDLADPASLADSLRALAETSIERWRLGEHVASDFEHADILVVNPAIKPGHPLLEAARSRGAKITSEIELVLGHCPALVIGVTGSNGKSTTASMIAAIAREGGRRVWLGGNIGGSLLGDLSQMRADDVVVLELSSFQLHHLSAEARGPHVAVVTNLTANHLDWHGSLEHYRHSKQRLFSMQCATDHAVLNRECPEIASWTNLVRERLAPAWPDECVPPLLVLGSHNRENAALAAAATQAIDCSRDAIHRALASFHGLPHRLEFVALINGRRFYNDSKATTPEAAIAALRALDAPLWLLMGGHAKGGNYQALAKALTPSVCGVACFGHAATMLADQVQQYSPTTALFVGPTLDAAMHWCWSHSRPGDQILLAPACASFDQYRDFTERGEHFGLLAQKLA